VKKFIALSLFDGMSCGQIAFEKAGIKIKKYYASEIDKYAIQIAKKNYPKTIHLGSVIDLKKKDLKKLFKGKRVILIGGSPCQGFSLAGHMKGSVTKEGVEVTSLKQYLKLKKAGFEFDGQSYLFWEYVRIWKIVKPKYFFLENVRVTKKWLPMFNEAMGVEPYMVNSSLVSAQNRVRYYWTNLPNFKMPKDKGILLKDILEDNPSNEFNMSEKTLKGFERHANRHKERGNGFGFKPTINLNVKSVTLTNPGKNRQSDNYVLVNRPCELISYDEKSICHHAANAVDINGHDSIKRVYSDTGKGPTLNTCTGGNREPKVLIVPEATKKGFTEINDGECFDIAQPNSKTRRGRRGRSMKDKSNCLTTSHQFMQYTHPTYRKLTPIECERLQTVPDNYTEGVSNSQRYKMLGNGWTVDVIAHFFKIKI